MNKFALIELLKELEAKLPPPDKCHHSLHYTKSGSDAEGWTGELVLTLTVNGRFYSFLLDDKDFNIPANELVSQIINGFFCAACLDQQPEMIN